MPTVRKIKRELDERGIQYPRKARKADLIRLFSAWAEPEPATVPIIHEVDPTTREIATAPEGFIDPNGDKATQAV